MELWNTTTITCIAHAVGSPLQVDQSSLVRNHTNGPRFQILINAIDEPLEKLEIEIHSGNWFKQEIMFEFLPRICSNCRTLGHSKKMCHEARDRAYFYNAMGWSNVRNQPQKPYQENQVRGPPPHNESRMRGPPPRNKSQARGPLLRGNPWLNKGNPSHMGGEQRMRDPPPYANAKSKSRERSRVGRKAPQNRSKSAPKRKGKTSVGGRCFPSNNDKGRNQVWQEKAREDPIEPTKLNAHIRFESPPSSSFSNRVSVEMSGDQALRLQFPREASNTNKMGDSSDDETLDEESSS